MTRAGPLNELPIACTLTPGAGKDQAERWHVFEDEYALRDDCVPDKLVVHYARTVVSERRLRELVALEDDCCSLVDRTVDEHQAALRFAVTGDSDQLGALNVRSG